MPKFVNTFIGGLDKDTAPTSYSNKNYYNARNFSIVVAEDLSSATLTNDKGVTTVMTYEHADGRTIVGLCEFSDSLVIFVRGLLGVGEIHEIPFTAIHSGGVIDLSALTYLAVTNDFNFGDRVEAIAREENTSIRKLYWVDNVNPIRYCNLYLGETVLSAYDITQFEINQLITLTTPLYSKLISGSLKAGMYQYAYCLYNQNEGETVYSPLSQFVQITETGLTPTSNVFKGSNIGTVTTSGIEVIINDANTNYNYIRVISIFYTTPTSTPEMTIIYEGSKVDTLTISHTGTQLLGTLTIEEAIAPATILTAKTLTSKYNYLFLGNIKETNFDISLSDFDARTYRFFNDGVCKMYNSYADYVSTPANSKTFTSANYPSVEDEFNLNPLNYVGWDIDSGRDNLLYKYQSDGITLGGEGPNVSYKFITRSIKFRETVSGLGTMYTIDNSTQGLRGYANPYENDYVGYQRDEVYRLGIVFYTNKAQTSFVKWLGDMRFPKLSETNFSIYDNGTSVTYFNALGLQFNFNFVNLLTTHPEIVAYQIVRTERTYNDSTVIDCGYVGHLTKDGTNNLFWGAIPGDDNLSNASNTPRVDNGATVKDIVEYICPETNYNKNNYVAYNRIDIYTGTPTTTAKQPVVRDGVFNYGPYRTDNAFLTEILPGTRYKGTINIDDSYLFSAQRSLTASESLPSSFGSYRINSRSHVDINWNRGYKGTTLLLKLESDLNPASLAISNLTCPYVTRRNHIYPYGGFSLSALGNNTYYPCSKITPIDTTTLEVWGGDTYISVFEYMRVLWADASGDSLADDRMVQIVQCLVESKLNLNYNVNERWTYYDDGAQLNSTTHIILDADLTYCALWETSGTWEFHLNSDPPEYFVQTENLYTYNPVYSLTTGAKSFIPKPINFLEETNYPTRVWKSDKKINGELTDSWLKFLPNNNLDIDNQFGDLHRLYNHNNKLIYFQDKGFGVIPVEDREVISTNNGPTSIGTGDVLTRYDYVSTNTGTSLPNSIIGTERNLYFVDNNLKKITQWQSDGGVEYISDTKGLHSYMLNANLTSVNTLYNPNTKEIHFSFPTESLTYNEYSENFRAFSDTTFNYGVFNGGVQYILANNSGGGTKHVSINSLYTGAYGRYSSDHLVATLYPSTLDLIINPAKNLVGRFDIIELATEVFDNGVTNNLTTTFTSLRVRNNYQDTGTIPLDSSSNVTRRFRTWRYNQLRNSSDDGRIVDNYARLSLSFTNDGTTKMLVNDITTTFTPLNLR